MSDIIPSSVSDSKPILSVEKFWTKWQQEQFPDMPWAQPSFGGWLEFAEAYAVAYMNWYAEIHVANNARQNDLIRRAAELLREVGADSLRNDSWERWEEERKQLLKDAGLEK